MSAATGLDQRGRRRTDGAKEHRDVAIVIPRLVEPRDGRCDPLGLIFVGLGDPPHHLVLAGQPNRLHRLLKTSSYRTGEVVRSPNDGGPAAAVDLKCLPMHGTSTTRERHDV